MALVLCTRQNALRDEGALHTMAEQGGERTAPESGEGEPRGKRMGETEQTLIWSPGGFFLALHTQD